MDNIEEKIFTDYNLKNPHNFNKFLPNLLRALSLEKNEDEKISLFESRLISETKDALNLGEIL